MTRYTIALPHPLPCLAVPAPGEPPCGLAARRSLVMDLPDLVWLCGPVCHHHLAGVHGGYRKDAGVARFLVSEPAQLRLAA